MFDLTGKVVVITGGSGKLGQQHAEAVAEHKGIPIILDLSSENPKAVANRISEQFQVQSQGIVVDITLESDVSDSCQRLLMEFLTPEWELHLPLPFR